jgi:hypothetical protein
MAVGVSENGAVILPKRWLRTLKPFRMQTIGSRRDRAVQEPIVALSLSFAKAWSILTGNWTAITVLEQAYFGY